VRELLGGKPKGEIKVKTAYAVLDTILDFGLGGVSSHLCGSSVGWRKSVLRVYGGCLGIEKRRRTW
jgi:hypothetical protein